MKITRDVVTDLLPVYLSGEASADTQTLVDEFLKTDPEVAGLVAAQRMPLEIININLTKENEMKTLKNTKSLLQKRTLYLAFAVFFTMFTVSFRFEKGSMQWMWLDTPVIAVVCIMVGILMWFGYMRTNQSLKDSGL